ncbi:hypothetical protein, partial [Klebsiella quasipneumoniae]|uniref:hypothetical protein n=1 Tax=Klebsiella quasipneumoniae TaxID=1463165 RepID=UPI003003BBD4
NDYYYKAPPKTMVQVFLGDPYSVSAETDLIVPVGFESFPFFISTPDASPFSGFQIDIVPDVVENVKITFSPNPVEFENGDFLAYFTIYCEGCVDGTKYTFKYELSGDDESTFEFSNPAGTFTAGSYSDTAAVASVSLNVVDQTSASITLTTNDDAIVYWALVSKNLYDLYEEYSSLDMIEEVALPLVY